MSDNGAYALLKTIRSQRDGDTMKTPHTAMTRRQENDRWLSVQTSAVPIHTTQIDNPLLTPEPQAQQVQQAQQAPNTPRPTNFGFYREVVARHDQAMRQIRKR